MSVGLGVAPSQPFTQNSYEGESDMAVQAKFYVGHVDQREGATAATVNLQAVCRGAANRAWSSYTPAGSIQMTVRNDKAVEYFEPGAEYLVTFTKVEKPELGDGHAPEPMNPSYDDRGVHPDELDEYVICGACGVQAKRGPDGEYDWSAHTRLYQPSDTSSDT